MADSSSAPPAARASRSTWRSVHLALILGRAGKQIAAISAVGAGLALALMTSQVALLGGEQGRDCVGRLAIAGIADLAIWVAKWFVLCGAFALFVAALPRIGAFFALLYPNAVPANDDEPPSTEHALRCLHPGWMAALLTFQVTVLVPTAFAAAVMLFQSLTFTRADLLEPARMNQLLQETKQLCERTDDTGVEQPGQR